VKYPHFARIESWGCDDLIAKIRRGEWISSFDGEMPQPNSEDSYNCFVRRREPYLGWNQKTLDERAARRADREAAKCEATARAQAQWEAEQRKIRQAKEAESKRLWEAEEARRAAKETARRAAEAPVRAYWASQLAKFADEPLVRIATATPFEFCVGENTIVFEGGDYLVPNSVAAVLVNNHWAWLVTSTLPFSGRGHP
jgi:hypothetical protein